MASNGQYARLVRRGNKLQNCILYADVREKEILERSERNRREYERRARRAFGEKHFELCDPDQVYGTVMAAAEAELRWDAYAGHPAEEAEKFVAERLAELEKTVRAQLPAGGASPERDALEKAIAGYAAAQDKKAASEIAALRKKTGRRAAKLSASRDRLAAKMASGRYEGALPEGVVLSVRDLCMYFGGVHAVDGLSFDVKKGEIFGLIGPNGAGKTTVFNSITQFYKPTSGELYFENKAGETIRLTDEKVHDIILHGIVRTFQNVEVIREVTVLQNLLIAGHRRFTVSTAAQALHLPSLRREEKVIEAEALKVLEFMGLTEYKDWYAYGLPYGVLKKIEIARTLMCSPQLIILDEPAAGLNDSETLELRQLIRRIRDEYGCTVLLVEHDMGLVMDICETVCAISFGKLLSIGTPAEIQGNPDVQKAYLGESDEPAAEGEAN